ncbi:MAG: M14 family zinc carboxypeptidase [Planctomycetaceae bacterium]
MDETAQHGHAPPYRRLQATVPPGAQSIAVLATCVTLAVTAVFTTVAGLTTVAGRSTLPTTSETETAESPVSVPLTVPGMVEDVAGHSVLGRPIRRLCIGAGPAILIMASIHGTEAAGTHLVSRLGELLIESPGEFCVDRLIILMPVVNPDGVENQTRGNANGVDLNRNFPAENRENTKRYGMTALSEPEALAIYQTIEKYQPVRIITLHEPLCCVDYDGPGLAVATAMAEVSPLPVKKLGTRPGSMGAFTGEARKIPTITLELPRDAKQQSAEELWQLYGPAMSVAVTHPIEPVVEATPVDGTVSGSP